MKQGPFAAPVWAWMVFAGLVIILLAIDHLAHRGKRGGSHRIALVWGGIWIAAGLGFDGFIWFVFGARPAAEYLATYIVEKALSTDNMFLFLIIFRSLNIPLRDQHKALFWGIAGAVVFRGMLIFLGAAALERWAWIDYVFGAIILYAAYRAFRQDPAEQNEAKAAKLLARRLPITERHRGGKFFVRESGRLVATPLFLALAAIELTDVMMAIDSVAVAFSMTRSDFVIYTSNIFAVLGLRALYLLLANTIGEMRYLHYGLSIVLAFAGIKLLVDPFVDIPPLVSIAFTVVVIGATVWLSLRRGGAAPAKSRRALGAQKN
jgi:tellurite resistance protein TerC